MPAHCRCLCLIAAISAWANSAFADQPATSPVVERSVEPTPADGPAITVSGIVVTSAGKAVPGACVVLRVQTRGLFYSMGVPHNRDILARTKTDANGAFAFEKVPIPPRQDRVITRLIREQGGAELVAWADGLAVAWTAVDRLVPPAPARLTLVPEAAVTGVIRDAKERGLPQVKLRIFGATRDSADLDGSFSNPDDWDLNNSEVPLGAITDAEGRFVLHHMPPDFRLAAVVSGPHVGRTALFIDTGKKSDLREVRTRGGKGATLRVYGSPMEVTVEPQRVLTVKVFDHAGQAVRDGGIAMDNKERHSRGMNWLDAAGEARIAFPKPGSYRFSYGADPLKPRFGKTIVAEIADGHNAPAVIRLPGTHWLTGRLVDADTGKGIAGGYISYVAKRTTEEEASGFAWAVSTADGNFRVPVVAGPGSLYFVHDVFGYFHPTGYDREQYKRPDIKIDVPPSGKHEAVTLSLARGLAVRGIVRDTDAKPVANAIVYAHNDKSPNREAAARTNVEGRFQLSGLSPRVGTLLEVTHAAGGAALRIEAQPDHPWDRTRWHDVEIRFKSGIALTGRVLYKEKPRAGVVMELFRSRTDSGPYSMIAKATTGSDGSYKLPGLQAGDRYYIQVLDPDRMIDPVWGHQSPYLQTLRSMNSEVCLPDVKLVSRNQTLRGVVIDPKGKPVAGISVSAALATGGFRMSLPRPVSGPPPWTKTDEQGRFELRQLPDELIELMAYRANPKGGRILYPAKVRPSMNQQDIRIILDPTLHAEIEDLDAPKKR